MAWAFGLLTIRKLKCIGLRKLLSGRNKFALYLTSQPALHPMNINVYASINNCHPTLFKVRYLRSMIFPISIEGEVSLHHKSSPHSATLAALISFFVVVEAATSHCQFFWC